ncbi:hypothetical protein [Micromonospora inyonensis]|nr:hypothetical protein [Micromonospora inyonensis]
MSASDRVLRRGPPSSLDELRSRYGLPHVSDRDAYRRSLEYWSEQGA